MVEKDAVSKEFRKQILGYGLATAEIVYRLPDRHWLLQTYVWQDYDMFPNFQALRDFSRSGKNHSKDPCSQLPLRIPSSSSQPNCTPSTACSGCTDSTGAITAERCGSRRRHQRRCRSVKSFRAGDQSRRRSRSAQVG
jgi:uncharacterized protein Usg